MIHVEKLTKTYSDLRRGHVTALQAISFEALPGQVYGLLGPNGAGKTTLIKCLTTLLLPTSGTAFVNGFEIGKQEDEVRASIGCMLMGERGLYWKLTARENLNFFGALYHLSPAGRRRRTEAVIERLNLGEIADRAVETYSSGQRMKLAFAKALINDAPLLILDEPTTTLDVPSARELRAVVRELNEKEGKTVIYTTHIMSEAETLCQRVAIVDQGRVLALGTVPELKAALKRDAVIRIEGVISARASRAVEQLPGITRVAAAAVDGRTQLTVVVQNPASALPRLIETLSAHGAVMQKIAPEEVTLEDVFITLTGRTLAEDTRAR